MTPTIRRCEYCGDAGHIESDHIIVSRLDAKRLSIEEFDAFRKSKVEKLGGYIQEGDKGWDPAPNAYLPTGYLEVWTKHEWMIVKEVKK